VYGVEYEWVGECVRRSVMCERVCGVECEWVGECMEWSVNVSVSMRV